MTTTAFDVATCSNQDFHTRMAVYSAKALGYYVRMTRMGEADFPIAPAYETFARHLHSAMGHRADQEEV
jgi:hypothetical protein